MRFLKPSAAAENCLQGLISVGIGSFLLIKAAIIVIVFNIGMANIENAGEKIMQARKTKA